MKILKYRMVKVWIIVTSILLVIVATASLVATQNEFLRGTINSVLGGETRVLKKGNPEDFIRYTTNYETKDEVLAAANLLNEKIVEEGIILLKNEDNTLPLSKNSKLTVLGKNSTNLVLGGSGSSAGTGTSADAINLYSSLKKAGFEYNPTAKSFFESSSSGRGRPAIPGMGSILTGFPISETEKSSYENNSELKSSYANYNDAAIVVITRIGGEGYDLPRTMFYDGSRYTNWSGDKLIPGARNKTDHYLQLDQNETDLIKEAGENFGKVIVVINSSTPIELGFLDDSSHYAYHPNIKGALWIGNPGESGITALGKVLNGEVNPSGKTIDTYSRNFKNDPTWNNFGNNLEGEGNKYTLNGAKRNAFFVDYEEGIYVGYRYYETRGFLEGDGWYNDAVVFPFGYGLSYTNFTQTIIDTSHADGSTVLGDQVIEVTVRVTNTGNVLGKEVVQLYYTTPYTAGEIEKAHVVLGDFAKTSLLEPNAFEDVVLKIPVRQMASYDFNDANNNTFKGYELDSGAYVIKLMQNAHQEIESFSVNVEKNIQYTHDAITNKEIKNLFEDMSDHIKVYLSRNDFEGTWPTTPTTEDKEMTESFIQSLTYKLDDQPTDPWFAPSRPNQSDVVLSYNKAKVKLYDLVGKDYDDPMWDQLLDQLTVEQMANLISRGNFKTMNIDNIAKPQTIDADGPMGFAIFMGDPSIYKTAYYASEALLGATWNEALALAFGEMVGDEGLIGNQRGDGRTYSGWYAPAMNIHRSQFGGRNFEYYSEDGYLSGKMATNVVLGAKSKGVYTYVKHFALNDQETNRDTTGLITWANEQAMRELYFLPFEMVVKEGQTTAFMSSFNRMGTTWAGGSYPLLTELLRLEWGFRGMVITDFNLTPYMNVDQMVRAGGDLNLSPSKDLSDKRSDTGVSAIRTSAKNILYTVANSNAMNGMGPGIVYAYKMPRWVSWIIYLNVGVVLIGAGWGALVITKSIKIEKGKEEQ